MRRPALFLAILAVPSFAVASEPLTFDSGVDLVAQVRAALSVSPAPASPAPAPASAAVEPEVVARPVYSDALPFGAEALAQGRLSFKLSARISPWEGHAVIAYVEVCDSAVVPSYGSGMEPTEYADPCRIRVFDFRGQLRTDLQARKVFHGARAVAAIVDAGYGPELDWGPGGVASRLAYRVENGRIVVVLKN